MSNKDTQWIKDLQNLETAYGPQTNFDEVMNRRKKKRRGFIWWTTRSSVILLIGFGSAYSYFNHFQDTPHSNQVDLNTVSAKVPQTKSNQPLSNNTQTTKAVTNSSDYNAFDNDSKIISRKKRNTQNQNQIQNAALATPLSKVENQKIEAPVELFNNAQWESIQEAQRRISQIFQGKNRLSRMNISTWKTIPSEVEWIDFELKEPEIKLHPGKLPWFAEFSAITGSNAQIEFDNQQNLSILGTQYIAQYQASLLREFQNATMWGVGFSYTEWVGNGQWRNIEEVITKTYDSTLMDSVLKSTFNTTTGIINYRIDKISVPIQFRFHTQILKIPIRIGAQLAPGITTLTEGNYFNETSFSPINRQRNFSFDSKFTIGPMIPITDQFTIIIEPSVVFQNFRGPNNQWNGKSFTGLGIGMMWSIN